MDITLDDLLILEPRFGMPSWLSAPDSGSRSLYCAEVSWAVTARATPPHLPVLRGKEMVIFPTRVASMLGADLAGFLRETESRQIGAIVLDRHFALDESSRREMSRIPVLEWIEPLSSDTETVINRKLTEFRGDLYRIGSELERTISDATVANLGIAGLVHAATEASRIPIVVLDASGRELAASTSRESRSAAIRPDGSSYEIRQKLGTGATLILGPLGAEQRVVARFLIARIASLAEAALRRSEAARPRGPRRVEAIESLLSWRHGSPSDRRSAALALGLDPDALFMVAVTHGESEVTVSRTLASLGVVHPAGEHSGRRTTLLAANSRIEGETFASRVTEIKRRWRVEHAEDGATLALSAAARGVASLPAAAREAHFVSVLQTQAEVPRRAASFESVEDMGELRLLYQLRDTGELRQFVTQALGSLQTRDQRGTLRATLRAFLESGGSQVDASQRLGIHRNTLAYRLRRIGELVGRDVIDPGSWLTLHLALRAAEMLDVWTDDN